MVAFNILSFEIVAILPLSDAESPWEPKTELASEALIVRNDELSVAVHLTSVPMALVRLTFGPRFHTIAVGQTFLDFALVLTKDIIVVGDLCILTCQILFGLEVTTGNART